MIGSVSPTVAFSPPYPTRPDAAQFNSGNGVREGGSRNETPKTSADASSNSNNNSTNRNASSRADQTAQLSEADQAKLTELKKRDQEVRAHEMAHVAAGGSLVTKGASFSYETGPDGQRYAVGGEVSIDTSKGDTPQETRDKAAQIRGAALAPADPSPQDRRVAAMAAQMAMQASMELAAQRVSGDDESSDSGTKSADPAADAANSTTRADAATSYAGGRMQSAYTMSASASSYANTPADNKTGINLFA